MKKEKNILAVLIKNVFYNQNLMGILYCIHLFLIVKRISFVVGIVNVLFIDEHLR